MTDIDFWDDVEAEYNQRFGYEKPENLSNLWWVAMACGAVLVAIAAFA